jgi:hypothetical protein
VEIVKIKVKEGKEETIRERRKFEKCNTAQAHCTARC